MVEADNHVVVAAGTSFLEHELDAEQLATLAVFIETAQQELDQIRAEQAATDTDDDHRLEEANYAYYLNKDQLIRFLRAREYRMEKSRLMFVAWVKWRLEYRADRISPELIRGMLEIPVMKIAGYSRDNGLIIVCQPRFHTPGQHHIDDLVRYGMFIVETAIKKIEREGRSPLIHCIYDRTQMTSANRDSSVIKFAFRMASMLQDFYCERLGNFYVINANWMYWVAHKMIKPFLATRTREKIILINNLEQLDEWIAPEQLLPELGGTLQFEYDAEKQWGLSPNERV